MNFKVLLCFSFSILLQVSILIGEFVTHVYPHWTGREILLKIRPVDPRSLFRGQYVQLDYNLGLMANKLVKKFENEQNYLRHGQVIYISLIDKHGVSIPDDVYLKKPEGLISIQGRVERKYPSSRFSKRYPPKIKLGIEAYFSSPENAKSIENSIRNNRSNKPILAKVMLASNGKAALSEIIIQH